ncbi:MAG: BBP7 family outer membrane beta-barrel protein [Pirellulales bacterium]
MKLSSVWTGMLLASQLAVGSTYAQTAGNLSGPLPPTRIQDYQGQSSVGSGRGYWDYQSTGAPRIAMADDEQAGREVVIGNPSGPAELTAPAPTPSESVGSGAFYGDAGSTTPSPVSDVSTYDNSGLESVYGNSVVSGSNWYFGIYGLAFKRDDDYDIPLFTPVSDPSLNVITTNTGQYDFAGGFEARLGRYLNDRWAVEALYWGLFPNDQNYRLDSWGYPGGFNSTLNLGSLNYDNGAGALPLDTYFTGAQMVAVNRTFDYNNVELNFLRNACPGGCGPSSFVWLAGARYLQLDETFCMASDLNNTVMGDDPPNELFYNINVVNRLVGFQIGGIWDRCVTSRMGLRVGSKVGIYGNQIDQYQRIYGGTGVNATVNTGPYAGSDYYVQSQKNDVSWITELFAGLTYRVWDNWRLTGGYRALIVSDVAIPYGQIPYRFSDLGEAANINANDSLLLHGIYAGLEYNW